APEALLEPRPRLRADGRRAGRFAGAGLEPGRPTGDGMAGGSDPEEIRDAADLSARRLRDPLALPDGDSGGDLRVRRRLRDRTRGRVHGDRADGRRALGRASARSWYGERARGRWRGRSRRSLAGRAD